MNKIAVVIPTYNRERNLFLALVGLERQTVKPHEVIVVDDGSTDRTFRTAKMFQETMNMKYYWHRNQGYRVSLNRNQGTRLIRKETTHILYIDSDVVLNKEAIEAYYEIIADNPDCIVCGRYDWLPPMKIEASDIKNKWTLFATGLLPAIKVDYDSGMVGKDPRSVDWRDETPTKKIAALSGNLLIPRRAFDVTGGFDENIEGRGQDGEFTRALAKAGFKGVFSERVIGYHISHYRDKKWETRSVRKTIRYIHKKYNIPLKEEHLPPLLK